MTLRMGIRTISPADGTRRVDLSQKVALALRFSPALVFVSALALYALTLAPTVLWGGGDFARFQVWAAALRLEGGAEGHPLWVALAHVFTALPLGDSAYRVNLSSAVFSAAALSLVHITIYDLIIMAPQTKTRSHGLVAARLGAWFGTISLAVSHTFWTYAVMPKVYSLNSLIFAAALLCAVRWSRARRTVYLYGLAVALGVGAVAHLLFFALTPAFLVYIVLVMRERATGDGRWTHVVGAALLYIVLVGAGFALLHAITVGSTDYADAGGTGIGFIHQFLQVLVSPHALALGLGVFVALMGYQFFLTLLVVAVGVRVVLVQRPLAALFFLLVILDVAFVFAWLPGTPRLGDYAQNWHFYLPSYMVLAVLAGLGAARLWTRLTTERACALGAIALVLPIVAYAAAPRLARGVITRLDLRTLPGRDNAAYLLSPWKQGEHGARAFGTATLRALSPHAVLLADYSIYWVVRYLHDVEGVRKDVTLIELAAPPALDQQTSVVLHAAGMGAPLYIADNNRYYNIAAFEHAFRIVPTAPVYRLLPRH